MVTIIVLLGVAIAITGLFQKEKWRSKLPIVIGGLIIAAWWTILPNIY